MKIVNRRQVLKLGLGLAVSGVAANKLEKVLAAKPLPVKPLPCGLKELPLPVAHFKDGKLTNLDELFLDIPYEFIEFSEKDSSHYNPFSPYSNEIKHSPTGECCVGTGYNVDWNTPYPGVNNLNGYLRRKRKKEYRIVNGVKHVVMGELHMFFFKKECTVWVNEDDAIDDYCGEMNLQSTLWCRMGTPLRESPYGDFSFCSTDKSIKMKKTERYGVIDNVHSHASQAMAGIGLDETPTRTK